jgi:hypothetical protein
MRETIDGAKADFRINPQPLVATAVVFQQPSRATIATDPADRDAHHPIMHTHCSSCINISQMGDKESSRNSRP